MKTNRKDFLKTLGAGMLGAATLSSISSYGTKTPKSGDLKFGMASYSFREFGLEESIVMVQRLGLKYMALKSMHMPMDSSVEEINAAAAKVRNAGIDLYGAGVIYMKTEDEVNNAFEYAKTAALSVIIGVPNHELLPLVEQKVMDTDIKVAIHNHGPGDQLYSSVDDVYYKIKDLDNRIGFCLDIGHTFRIGEDPVEKAKQYAERLYDVHFKDVHVIGPEGASIECGRGVMDLPSFLNALLEINYQGIVALEYEKDSKDPLPGAAESIGYARGVVETLN